VHVLYFAALKYPPKDFQNRSGGSQKEWNSPFGPSEELTGEAEWDVKFTSVKFWTKCKQLSVSSLSNLEVFLERDGPAASLFGGCGCRCRCTADRLSTVDTRPESNCVS